MSLPILAIDAWATYGRATARVLQVLCPEATLDEFTQFLERDDRAYRRYIEGELIACLNLFIDDNRSGDHRQGRGNYDVKQIDYEITARPTETGQQQAPPPPALAALADTLHDGQALKIRTTGCDDVEVMRIQAWVNALPKRYNAPFSVATSRQREGEDRFLYAWAIPPRVKKGKG